VHPPPSPARANFTLITECTPESSGCNSVYSVVQTVYTDYRKSIGPFSEKTIHIEIDTIEKQQTEKIKTELKDVDRIRANRCTQLCPGSHHILFPPCRQPPSRQETPRWRVQVQDNPAVPSPSQMREF
jgi:hypothetical protein